MVKVILARRQTSLKLKKKTSTGAYYAAGSKQAAVHRSMAYRGVAPQRLSVGGTAVVVDDAGGRCVAGADGRQGHGAAAQAGAAKEDFVVARV